MRGDAIVSFYRGETPDDCGRRIEEIWSWDHDRLESVHDFIQWLFPNDQPSAVNPLAPLVTRDTREAFGIDADLRERLLRSLDLMLAFYGLERVDDPGATEIRLASTWEARKATWLHPGNHNHLRITRILIALDLLGLPRHAAAFRACLRHIHATEPPGCITDTTLAFWLRRPWGQV